MQDQVNKISLYPQLLKDKYINDYDKKKCKNDFTYLNFLQIYES